MLIKSLEALNFRKYNKLIIDNIPESGIITISGSNESGKTSIGEAICFALFGRTFFQDDKSLHKIVCWGTDNAEVTLTFKAGDGSLYSLWRNVNKNGEVKVKFSSLNNDFTLKNNSVLEDSDAVNQALEKLLGFNFNAFSNSFYLAQRELTSPDPQSQSIKQMAGISAYAKITDELEESNQNNKDSIEQVQPQVNSNQEKLDEVNLDETWLPELIDAEETLDKEQQERSRLISHFNGNEELYTNNHKQFHAASKSFKVFSFLGKFALFTSIILWLLWVINLYYPAQLMEFLATNFVDSSKSLFTSFAKNWLLPSAIITLLITLLSWVCCKKSKSKMVNLNTEAKDFSKFLDDGHRYVTTLTETLLPERIVQLLHKRTDDSSTLQVLPSKEQFNNLTHLIKDSENYQASPNEMTSTITLLSDAIKKQEREIGGFSENILDDINDEKTRTDKAGKLRSTLHQLNKTIDKCSYTIGTQTLALQIMQRAAADSIKRFNQNISDISAKTLPSFTENRYSKLKIAEDFTVQIFSDNKNDYMDFDEISSGTQRQVMLSLRIAMSEQLSMNSGNEEQFIFLDEPFAFFDQSRTSSALENLPKISDVIQQIWISAQEFPEDIIVAKHIECPAEESELIT